MCQPGRTQPGMQGVHTPRPATRNHVAVSGLETGSPTAKMRRSYQGLGRQPAPCQVCSSSQPQQPRKQSRALVWAPQLECDATWGRADGEDVIDKVAASVQPTLGVTNPAENAILAGRLRACAFRQSAPHNSIRASERQPAPTSGRVSRCAFYSTSTCSGRRQLGGIPLIGRLLLRRKEQQRNCCFSQKHTRHGNRDARRLEARERSAFSDWTP
jgi:hypothetical protein